MQVPPDPTDDERRIVTQLRLLARGHRAFAILNSLATVAILPLAVGIARVQWDAQLVQMESAGLEDLPDFGPFKLVVVGTLVLLAAIAAVVFWGMAGWIERRVKWRSLVAISVLNLIAFPFGTMLSCFALVVLYDAKVKSRFDRR